MMQKRAVLRFDGSLEQGFRVTLEISDLGAPVFTEVSGALPASIALSAELKHWQKSYRASLGQSRITLEGISVQTGALSQLEACKTSAKKIQNLLKQWLSAPEFQPIEGRLRDVLSPNEFIEILLKSSDPQLHRIPWHLWDFIERHPNTELSISSPSERLTTIKSTHNRVRILAILGDRRGIDTEADRKSLEQLPNAELVFLVEPSRQELHQHLWEQAWDILFFAGHSQTEENRGCLNLNPTESLTLEELNFGLRKAISRGLQLAIFNSCDGLGLAYDLEQLHIPHTIVMGEPVPDRVAQEFLKEFLKAFANSQPLQIAIRQAREYLQGLEGDFPCASWLPTTFQNAATTSLTWQDLYKPIAKTAPKWSKFGTIPLVMAVSIACTGLVAGTRYLGLMEAWEFGGYDRLMKLRPAEKPDSRFLIVTVTEKDIQTQNQAREPGNSSLSDRSLAKLIDKLGSKGFEPAIIGLNIYRSNEVDKSNPVLAEQMKNSKSLIGICKVSSTDSTDVGIGQPPEINPEQIGFSDILGDTDRVVRRHYLAMSDIPPRSKCKADLGFGLQIALGYLEKKGIEWDFSIPHIYKIGNLTFPVLESHTGGYQRESMLGEQILLNYRATPDLIGFAPQVTLEYALSELKPEEVKDKIVLIGTVSAARYGEFNQTPYESIPPVVLQGQMASQLLSAVLNGRLLIRTWPTSIEISWIGGWSFAGGLLIVLCRRPLHLALAVVVEIGILTGICFGLFQMGYWVPLIPAIIGLTGSASLGAAIDKQVNNQMKVES
jgi:CHASE2 domain-containing sensor protein